MRFAVRAHKARAVDAEEDGQVLQAHVVQHLVQRALEKGGIQAHDGAHAALRHARRHGDGVFFADADVEKALRECFGKARKPHAVRHRRRNADEAFVPRPFRAKKFAQRGGEGVFGGGEIFARAVVEGGRRLRRGVPLALLRDGVQQHGLFQLSDVREHVDELVQVVPVDGADVLEAAAVEKVVFVEPALKAVFEAAQRSAERARLFERSRKARSEGTVPLFCGHARNGAVGGAVFIDRHAVVVEDDEEVFGLVFGGEHRLERQPVAQRRVADEADDLARAARKVARVAQPDARRKRIAAVPGDERVVFALRRVGEAAHAALCTQGVKGPAREQFMHVCLVPYVEHELILREVEHLVQGEGQLYRAQVRRKMPAVFLHGGNELPAQPARERFKLFYRIVLQLPHPPLCSFPRVRALLLL